MVNAQDGIHVWWQVNGDFMRSPTGEHLGTSFRTEVEVGDVTGDGLADLVSATGSTMEVWAQKADRSFAGPMPYVTGTGTTDRINGIAIGDVDADGLADVHASVGGNKPYAWVVTWPQLTGGFLGKPQVRTSYDIPEPLEAADVTGDGRADLVTAHGGWNRVGVYDSTPGDRPTEALFPVTYASHYSAQGIAVGDVSGDGRADVVLADYNYGLVLLRSAAPGDDIIAPDTTITSKPATTLRSRTATFAFTANEASTFSCSMDAAAWTPCTSPTTYTDLSQGSHRFQVRATDLAGNVDPMAAAASFTVEGPDTSIIGGTSGTVRSTSAWFAFASQPTAASYQCSLDGAPWVACTSQQSWTGLATGTSHTFDVRGISVRRPRRQHPGDPHLDRRGRLGPGGHARGRPVDGEAQRHGDVDVDGAQPRAAVRLGGDLHPGPAVGDDVRLGDGGAEQHQHVEHGGLLRQRLTRDRALQLRHGGTGAHLDRHGHRHRHRDQGVARLDRGRVDQHLGPDLGQRLGIGHRDRLERQRPLAGDGEDHRRLGPVILPDVVTYSKRDGSPAPTRTTSG